jgi:threonine/homoserine/homoserine lactone efflux protein
MDQLAALVGFAFVSSVTPGPNNVLLWASGAQFGPRRTGSHVVGTSLGLGVMALAVAAGIGLLLATIPALELAMKLGGSAYLLYLAWRIAGAHALERGSLARPMRVLEAVAFQLVNPKAWIFAIGAVTTFRPANLPVPVGSVLVAATMMAVIVPAAAIWVVAGDTLGRLLIYERRRRIAGLVMAVLVAATVVYVWI